MGRAMRLLLHFLPASVLALGCGHVTHVRPTPQGQVDFEASMGGPFARVSGQPIPVPLTTVGASYGVGERLDVGAHAHVLAATFGVAGADVQGSYQLVQEERVIPAVTVLGRLYGFTDFQTGARGMFEGTGTFSWTAFGLLMPYVTASGLVQFAGAPMLAAFGAGAKVDIGRWAVQLEGKLYEPGYSTQFTAVRWIGPASYGAWGAVLGLRYRWERGAP
jgi:hypothetical protein